MTLCKPCSSLDFSNNRTRRELIQSVPDGQKASDLARCRTEDQIKEDLQEMNVTNPRWKERLRDWPFELTCDLCNLTVTAMERLGVGTKERLGISLTEFCSTDYKERSSMRMSIYVAPEKADTFCGPLQPHEETVYAHKEPRTILELQECSNPVPTTADTLFPVGRSSPRTVESELSGRLLGSDVDFSLISHWIDRCTQMHGTTCSLSIMPAESSRRLKDLILIDVIQACITTAPENARYAALSYCWGTAPTLKHLIGNSAELKAEGALTNTTAPATIRDAITLVRRIGERYLWVDALCIVQDDPTSKEAQLSQMGLVYAQAAFTIVAAGTDADAGLPGIRSNTRQIDQSVLQVGEKALVTVIDNSDYYGGVRESVWETRAWTMQEKIISKKLLIFTDLQVYWSCWKALWLEEVVLEDVPNLTFLHKPASTGTGSYGEGFSSLRNKLQSRSIYDLYETLVNGYMKRHLSFQSDILNAFSGLCEVLGAIGNETFHWGLPIHRFEEALCWRLISGGKRNHARTNIGSVPFPSWSWAAWHGSSPDSWINWLSSNINDPWLAELPEILFYYQDLGDELKLVRNSSPHAGGSEEAISGNCIEEDRANIRSQWRHEPSTIQHTCHHVQSTSSQIHFWTSTCTLYVGREANYSSHSGYRYFLVFFLSDNPTASIMSVYLDMPGNLQFKDVKLMSDVPEAVLEPLEDVERRCEVAIVDFLVVKTIDDKVCALAVEWNDDVAYRIGIMDLKESKWVQLPNRKWKQVVLG
jgi:hypothetical protein